MHIWLVRLHPLAPEVLAGPVVYPAEQAEKVLRAYRDFIATAPDELGTIVKLTHAPAAQWLSNNFVKLGTKVLVTSY